MRILAKQNREIIMINARNTQNENDAEKITLEVPEQYEDFNKKIVFITTDGIVWDIIQNNEYLIKKAITKYKQVDFYIWLTKGEVDFRTQTKTLKFYDNVDASEEITDEEIGRVNTVINILEEEITKVEDLETEIDGKLEEIDTAIDDVNTAIDEVQNLDLDAEKINKTTTVTLTKKDSTTKTVQIADGISLQFDWQGTYLGIKTENQQEYTYVNLQGVQGPVGPQGDPFTIKKTYSSIAEMNADFNNMQLGDYVMIASTVEIEDNAKLYTRGESQWIFITDFSGATGIRGETGLTPNIQIGTVTQGSSFNVTRTGTNENPVLNFTLVKGDKGDTGNQGIQGETGNGIASITKTATVGLVDTYTITYTDGNTTTFTVTNGEDGEVTQAQLDKVQDQVDKMKANQLTNTVTGTTINLNDSANDYVRSLTLKRNTTQKTTVGRNLLPTIPVGSRTGYGITLTSTGDGIFTVVGTSTAAGDIYFALENPVQLPSQDIYVHLRNTQIINGLSGLFYGSGRSSSPSFSSENRILKSTNLTDMNLSYVGVHFVAGIEVNTTFTPSFELTDEETDFEKYTGGQPSPNPQFPQTIKNAGDDGSISFIRENKNLWINEIENGETSEGITATKNSDGSLAFNGTATNLSTFRFVKSNHSGKYLEEGKNYTISGVDNINTRKYDTCIIGNIGNSLTTDIRTFSPVSTREITSANSYIQFAIGTVLNNYTIKPMIVEGNSALLPFEQPLKQTLIFPTQTNQKLLGYTAADGLHQQFKIVTVSGTSATFEDAKENGLYYCNKKASGNLNGKTITFDEAVTDAIVQYELADEVIENYSSEQQTAYNQMQELETYKNVTHIYSEDETPANLDLDYVQDINILKNQMNDLETRIEVLESGG